MECEMHHRKEAIEVELKFLYEQEKEITDRIQDLLQEKIKLQATEAELVKMCRFKSKYASMGG